jgi:hypothetical protein
MKFIEHKFCEKIKKLNEFGIFVCRYVTIPNTFFWQLLGFSSYPHQ